MQCSYLDTWILNIDISDLSFYKNKKDGNRTTTTTKNAIIPIRILHTSSVYEIEGKKTSYSMHNSSKSVLYTTQCIVYMKISSRSYETGLKTFTHVANTRRMDKKYKILHGNIIFFYSTLLEWIYFKIKRIHLGIGRLRDNIE